MELIRQTEAAECGLACVAMVANYHGQQVDLATLRQRYNYSLKGATLRSLMRVADELSLSTRALSVRLDHLDRVPLPAIIHWDMNHFVVLNEIRGGKFEVYDPSTGVCRLEEKEFSARFTGVVLEVAKATPFKAVEAVNRIRLTDLWSATSGLKRSLLQLGLLAVMLQALTLLAPLYLQLVVDRAVESHDVELLLVLASAFAGVYLITAAVEAARGWAAIRLSHTFTYQLTGNIFRHLLRLPAAFFEKRHIGDITSRLSSVRAVKDFLSGTLITVPIDLMMLLSSGALLLFYSPQLALVSATAVGSYLLILTLLLPTIRRQQDTIIHAGAKEQTFLLESVRSARAVKLFGREVEREARWRTAYSDVINSATRFGMLNLKVNAFQQVLQGGQVVLVVFLGARLVIQGSLSLGMLFAFMAYRQIFQDRAMALSKHLVDYRTFRLHMTRLADIVHTPLERSGGGGAFVPSIEGAIRLENVGYRYGASDRLAVENVSLHVRPGEFVAIVGPSGCGKSTLFKLLLGLDRPESGRVLIDGKDLATIDIAQYRRQVGVVMQDDQLLSGTIADNIGFFDPDLDMDNVIQCARDAQIHDDIEAMPMDYMSLIGDMGSALSGGQRQRVLIARALYHQPRILFMDEGTANLDLENETRIVDAVKRLRITRVVVAHGGAMLGAAERVIDLSATTPVVAVAEMS